MTTAPERIGEIKIRQETTANEAIADPTTYWANAAAKQLRAWDVDTTQLKKLSEDDPSMQTHAMADPAKLLLGKQGQLPFSVFLTGLSAAAADATAVVQDNLGLLLSGALGGEQLDTSTLVASSNTGIGATTPIEVNDASGLSVGGAVRISGEMRRITAVNTGASPDTITLDQDLSAAPSSGTLVAAAATYYPDEAALVDLADAGHLTFATLFRGYHSEDQWQARGCFFQIALANLGPNMIPRLNVVAHIQDWDLVTSVAVGGSFTEQTPPAQLNNGLYIQDQGTVTRNIEHTKSLGIDLGLVPAALASPAAENGIQGHAVFGGRTMLQFEALYDSKWNDKYEAGTKSVGGYQIGTGVLVSFPELIIDESPSRTGDNATYAAVKMHANNGSGSTDLQRAKFAIHRFGT